MKRAFFGLTLAVLFFSCEKVEPVVNNSEVNTASDYDLLKSKIQSDEDYISYINHGKTFFESVKNTKFNILNVEEALGGLSDKDYCALSNLYSGNSENDVILFSNYACESKSLLNVVKSKFPALASLSQEDLISILNSPLAATKNVDCLTTFHTEWARAERLEAVYGPPPSDPDHYYDIAVNNYDDCTDE